MKIRFERIFPVTVREILLPFREKEFADDGKRINFALRNQR